MEDVPALHTGLSFFSRNRVRKKSGHAGIVAFSFLLAQRHSEVLKCMGNKKKQEMKSKQQFRIKFAFPLVYLNQICLRKRFWNLKM